MTTQPDPQNFPSYRAPSRKSAPGFSTADARRCAAGAFEQGADAYHAIRPGYPADVVALAAGSGCILDLGAGTGQLTRSLEEAFPASNVYACDPSPDMCAVLKKELRVPVWRATAERTALADASVDAVTVAQAWHWFDVPTACAELDRIITPGGRVVLVWNTMAVETDPWILRLSRIMHSGDVLKAGFYPEVAGPWTIKEELRLLWTHEMVNDQLHDLMHTRSYWLRAKDNTRTRMTHNLNWYLREHMGFAPGETVSIPYRTDAFVLERARD